MRTRTDPHEIRLLRRTALILGALVLFLLLLLVIQWSKGERRTHEEIASTEAVTSEPTSETQSGGTSDTEEPPADQPPSATEILLRPTSPAEPTTISPPSRQEDTATAPDESVVETETETETIPETESVTETESDPETEPTPETTPVFEGSIREPLAGTAGLLFEPNDSGGCTLIGVEEDAAAVTCMILPPLSSDGLPVTEIAPGAFSGCKQLAVIFLPPTLQTLRADAFEGCTALVSITVDRDSASFCTRDGVLYDADCRHLIFCPPARSIPLLTLPAELTHIDENALAAATGIQAVTYEGTRQGWAQVEISRGNNLLSVLGVACEEE